MLKFASILFVSLSIVVMGPLTSYASNLKTCAAIRGNGDAIFAHWTSLAKLVENYGPMDAAAGGSSASITIFLYESMLLNPALVNCQTSSQSCLKQKGEQLSFLLKSLSGYLEYLDQTEEVIAIKQLAAQGLKLKSEMDSNGTSGQITSDPTQIQNMFARLMMENSTSAKVVAENDAIQALVNPQAVKFISSSTQDAKATGLDEQKLLAYRTNEVENSLRLLGKFDAKNDSRLFVRPGILNFAQIASLFGRIANFYAGYGFTSSETAIVKALLKRCSATGTGKLWNQIVAQDAMCGEGFKKVLSSYRGRLMQNEKNPDPSFPLRIDDEVGATMPALVTTSLLAKKGTAKYKKVLKEYRQTIDPNYNPDLQVGFDNVRFGYFGQVNDLEEVEQNLKNPNGFMLADGTLLNMSEDFKSQKFESLKQATWKTALSLSPAEPGLSQLLPIPGQSDLISAGGWADLHPVPVLKALGCEKVVYITRVGGESLFALGVIKRLTGIDGLNWEDITAAKNIAGKSNDTTSEWGRSYNLANPNSSIARSISLADAVWCTHWDGFEAKQVGERMVDAYQSALYINQNGTNASFFNSMGTGVSTIGANDQKGHEGCIPLN